MQITLKLMGVLRSKLPPDAVKGKANMEVNEGMTINQLLEQLDISSGHVHLVMLNDDMVEDADVSLSEGDVLTVFPPVAGG